MGDSDFTSLPVPPMICQPHTAHSLLINTDNVRVLKADCSRGNNGLPRYGECIVFEIHVWYGQISLWNKKGRSCMWEVAFLDSSPPPNSADNRLHVQSFLLILECVSWSCCYACSPVGKSISTIWLGLLNGGYILIDDSLKPDISKVCGRRVPASALPPR